jgi:multiple sugar transport system substrate-binding protein
VSETETQTEAQRGRLTRRRVVGAAAVVLGAAPAALAACGPAGGGAGGGGERPATAKVSGPLTYLDWRLGGSPADEHFYKTVRDGYVAKHPEVKFEQLQVEWGKVYLEKLVTMTAGGTPPDVIFSSIIWGRDLWADGLLEDLGPYIARTPSVAPNQYLDAAHFYDSWKGKTFGVPHVGPDFNVFYVNRKLLQEAGIPATDEALARWTWDDLVAAHPKLLKRAGDGQLARPGVIYNPGVNLTNFVVWLMTNDGAFYNKDRTGVAFNDARGRQVLQFKADLHSKHKTDEPLPAGTDLYNKAFPEGGVPIMYAGSWNQRNFLSNPAAQSLDYTMINIPRGPSGKGQATVAWTNMNVMARGSKNKDAAWAFVEHYSSLPVAIQQFQIWKQVSPRKDFLESNEWKEATRAAPSYTNFRKIADTGGLYPYLKFNDVSESLLPLVKEATIEGKRSVAEALGEMERLANQILSTVQ